MALNQSITFKYNTNISGTSFSNDKFENIDKNVNVNLR